MPRRRSCAHCRCRPPRRRPANPRRPTWAGWRRFPSTCRRSLCQSPRLNPHPSQPPRPQPPGPQASAQSRRPGRAGRYGHCSVWSWPGYWPWLAGATGGCARRRRWNRKTTRSKPKNAGWRCAGLARQDGQRSATAAGDERRWRRPSAADAGQENPVPAGAEQARRTGVRPARGGARRCGAAGVLGAVCLSAQGGGGWQLAGGRRRQRWPARWLVAGRAGQRLEAEPGAEVHRALRSFAGHVPARGEQPRTVPG